MSNIINAIINLVNYHVVDLKAAYNKNRVNSTGDALESYIHDLFANTFQLKNKVIKQSEVFSYLGNSSNPPDAMLRGGDAIEIKKKESRGGTLALNSSCPKQKLFACSPMISNACREAEEWEVKDIIYVVGVAKNNHLQRLCMVYGQDYCASNAHYERIQESLKTGIQAIPYLEFQETRELGRLNKVDPLGISYLRIRGMWGIVEPWTAFDYLDVDDAFEKNNFMCIINHAKWAELEYTEELLLMASENSRLTITDVEIKNPDNPAKLVEAKLILFSF